MRSPVQPTTTARVQDMFAQSAAVLTRPSPATFEQFERRSNLSSALIYVMVAAAVSAAIAAFFALFHSDVTFFGQLLTRLISVPLTFFVFTGLVYLIGRTLFRGTGTYPEVAYSFALFFVPLSIISTLIGVIPVIGWLAMFLITIAMIYFGFLAVQSSMNLRDPVSAGVTLVLAGLGQLAAAAVVGGVLGGLFAVGRLVTGS
ncbi:YIP1 family protein [Deinococcus sp. HMF7604]|uniref:YIP1 family protein n=1 Tax=Deinococcus betulae TaxID=2873312 RepID=UPI001CCA9B03|nr:YIP1 family protein [Deinococcus betulae]MBZ9749728.1 YIP1 family protein [Deinococcus betulae]